MTRSDLETLFYDLYREKSTNTSISTTIIDRWLNQAYKQAVNDIYPDLLNTTQTLTVPLTTLVTRSSATSLIVTSGTSFAGTTDLCVYTASRYDHGRLTTVATNTFTLSSPGILYEHTAGAYVTPTSFTVTAGRNISLVEFKTYTATAMSEITEMLPVSPEDMLRLGKEPNSKGTPSKYAMMSATELKVWPVPEEAGYILVRYKDKSELSLSESSSEPSLDEDYHAALAFYALAYAGLRDRDFNAYKAFMELYWAMIMRARMEYQEMKAQESNFQLKLGSLE